MAGKLHSGHRSRVKQKFIEYGLDNFSEHEVLELLLFFTIPQGDTNEIAHRLINHFGSLTSVFEASANALTTVKGVGNSSALLLKLTLAVAGRYEIEKTNMAVKSRILSSDEAGRFLLPYFVTAAKEETYLLLLTAVGKVISCRKIFEGNPAATDLNTYNILHRAIEGNAVGVVLAHNHPSGVAIPGKQDIAATAMVNTALKIVGIKLIDHIIIAGTDWVSMRESHMLD
ncbi:MAG: hypothetical protein LBN97_05135 [Oscillospiraceae bacterium]|jgi:DNA repair protein RadC|nr:hypothetical protein [Oscillospiraceae bacterium]